MNWHDLYDLLEALRILVILTYPLRTCSIAGAKVKTDKADSAILAHLLHADLVGPLGTGDSLWLVVATRGRDRIAEAVRCLLNLRLDVARAFDSGMSISQHMDPGSDV